MKGRNIAMLAAAGAVMTTLGFAPVALADSPRDCNDNSIIWCGAYTKAEFQQKVAQGDGHHTAANLQQIYFGEGPARGSYVVVDSVEPEFDYQKGDQESYSRWNGSHGVNLSSGIRRVALEHRPSELRALENHVLAKIRANVEHDIVRCIPANPWGLIARKDPV